MRLFKTFGKNPSGKLLYEISGSAQYKSGIFQNLHDTPMMAPDTSYVKLTWNFLNKPRNTVPPRAIPSVKTNLKELNSKSPELIWFGHSSYLLRINGINILVDPVFSGYASPFSFFGGCFPGSNVYTVEDMPEIDVLLITHDHYDHMDFDTVMKLQHKTKAIITSLGVGSHLEYWGIDAGKITELDWWQSKEIFPGITFTATPARHFSGRGFTRAKTLWSSFVLQAADYKIYLGGDSGYDSHFKEIGDKFGPFDLAILENGQYDLKWKYIHMLPEEVVQAAIDLKAKVLLPVHWGKFSLALHAWDEPIQRLIRKAVEKGQVVTTPMIGEPVLVNQYYPNKKWWIF